MIGICAQFVCQPGKNAEFEKLLVDFVNTVKATEPGTLVYQLVRSDKDPNAYFMLELYADQAALDAHGKTEHMAKLIQQIGPLFAGAPVLHQGAVIS
jgi:quinol monooxygenase YgiN